MPGQHEFSRRLLLKRAAAAGAVGLIPSGPEIVRAQGLAPTPQCHDGDPPTKPDIEGPYFKPRSPLRGDLVAPLTTGRVVQLEGVVVSRSCRPLTGVVLDLWHADEHGDYDETGFRYRGHLVSDANGRYSFRTIIPGLYPGRTRHYHMKVQAARQPLLTTQLYFPDEPRNQIDDYYSPRLELRIVQNSLLFDFVLSAA